MPTGRQALGAYGEALVARWYEARGFEVLARNWRCPEGELDLVLRRAALVVFCEVKTRSSDRFGAAEAVTPHRRRRLRRAAAGFLADAGAGSPRDRPRAVRFDVACVRGRDVEVIEQAF